MFDLSNPQKRERLLVILACVVLCVIVLMVLPGQFRELTSLVKERENLQTKIDDLRHHDQIAGNIQERLTHMTGQALVSTRTAGSMASMAITRYQSWLIGLASGAGLGNVQVRDSTVPGVKDVYDRFVFTLSGEGRMEQISEFLRRFYRIDYLHTVTSVTPTPAPRSPNMFTVQFRIEVLALPQVNSVNVPGTTGSSISVTDEERQMLAAIRERAILSAYTPPRQEAPTPPPPPPPPDFPHAPYCVVTGIVWSDGRPQCWIYHRTTERKYYLFEGESFMLDGTRVTIKKIEVDAERIQTAAAGGVYAISLGKSFDDYDEPSYFLTGIVDANGNPWTPDSAGDPHCVIVQRLIDSNNRAREIARHLLAAEASFPMAEVVATVRSIEPAANQIQMEVAGVVYTIRVGGVFAEFANE